jgi:hypothetical protein
MLMSLFSITKLRAVFVLVAAAAGIAGGTQLGEKFGAAISYVVERDPAELKDAIIWCIITAPFVCGTGAAWLAILISGSSWHRGAMWAFVLVGTLSASMIYVSYEPLKAFGTPVLDFELLLPEDLKVDGIGRVDLTIWNGASGQGCYIRSIDQLGSRQQISGSMTLNPTNYEPRVSVEFHNGDRWFAGGFWVLPYKPDTALEDRYRPWSEITIKGAIRDIPLVEGAFSIRYRARRFI